MDPRGVGLPGGPRQSIAERFRTGVLGAIAIGGAVVMGGAATLISADAHSGFVTASETCSSWSASVSLYNNVTSDRTVDVISTIPGTTGLTGHYDTTHNAGSQQIWDASGPSNGGTVTGEVTLNIYNGASLEFTQSMNLVPASDCTSTPKISTTPSGASVPVGSTIHDAATVTGSSSSPSGTVVFALYGPNNASCSAGGSAPVFTSAAISLVSVSPGVSKAVGTGFAPSAPGTYHWVASYSGDGGHLYNAVVSECADEAVLVAKAGPSIATSQSAGGNIGIVLSDTATVSGGSNPTGSVSFSLYGPTDSTCSKAPVFTSSGALASGKASSGSFTTTSALGAGTYRWIASYSGDANNAAATSGCQSEAVVVTGGGGSQCLSSNGSGTGAGSCTPIPSTGASANLTGITVGGFLLLSGLGFALLSGIVVPRRRRDNL